jgi:putative (di)nucleoside polyphosphate hydrolase
MKHPRQTFRGTGRTPHVTPTAGEIAQLPYRKCVGLMVFNKDGLVWIGRRVGSPNMGGAKSGWWQMPQGGIDPGETPLAAALRELKEETGMVTAEVIQESKHWYNYDLPPDMIGRALGGRYRGQTQRWFALRFTGDEREIDIDPKDHDKEFDVWRWAPMGELIDSIVPFKRPVYEKVVAEFWTLGG